MFSKLYDARSSANLKQMQFFPLPINFHISFGIRFLEHYKIDVRTGLMLVSEDYWAGDKGIFFQTDIPDSKFYGKAGIDFANNGGEAHGVVDYSESGGRTTYYCLGVGIRTSKHFNAELMYYFPVDKVFGYNNVYDFNTNTSTKYDKINYGMINIGFQYLITF